MHVVYHFNFSNNFFNQIIFTNCNFDTIFMISKWTNHEKDYMIFGLIMQFKVIAYNYFSNSNNNTLIFSTSFSHSVSNDEYSIENIFTIRTTFLYSASKNYFHTSQEDASLISHVQASAGQ